jgi:hypothetical protein
MDKKRDIELIQLEIDDAWEDYDYIIDKYNFWRFQVDKIEARIKQLGEEKKEAEG